MANQDKKEETKKVYDYDDIVISLENCILPGEKIGETPSMKDGLDRDTENDLRFYGCELIQTAGLLLKLPQVAMATGQILLQRFYYSKSLIKHDVEVCAMASVFLAAKIEESPRRVRDIINVCHHVKLKLMQKPIVPMDYFSNQYFNTKNAVIKAERRMLKELGFCVHVQHPHKIIITYLQTLEADKNTELARKAWNYMNDGMRTDAFIRFSPETVACACIFLAARITKVNLPMRPPWWKLFDSNYDDIEDISLSLLRLYSRPRRKLSHLEATVSKLKKILLEKKEAQATENQTQSPAGSFTPSHTTAASTTTNDPVKQSSKPNSPDNQVKKRPLASVIGTQKNDRNEELNDRIKNNHTTSKRNMSESDVTESSSESDEEELPSKKYAQQRRQYESEKYRSTSSETDEDRRPLPSKIHRSDSPEYRKGRTKDHDRNRIKTSHKDKNTYRNNDIKLKHNRHRSRSRSPVKRVLRSPSPIRKDKYQKEKDRIKSKYKYEEEKYSKKYLEKYSKLRR